MLYSYLFDKVNNYWKYLKNNKKKYPNSLNLKVKF